MKHLKYTFNDVIEMPYMLKELLYQSIIYDYGAEDNGQDDNFIDLDSASIEQIEKVLGAYKNE